MTSLTLTTKDLSLMAASPVPPHDPSLWERITDATWIAAFTAFVGGVGMAIKGIRDGRIAADQNEWQRWKDIVNQLTADRDSLKQELTGLKDRMERVEREHAERVASMQATINELTGRVVEVTEENKIKDLMIEGLEKTVTERDRIIENQEAEIKRYEIELDRRL